MINSMAMFTKEEAFAFIKDSLEIENAEERMKTDRKALLDEIIVAIQTHIPFQNLRLLSLPPDERHAPTFDEMKADFVSKIGGLCFNINASSYFLLKAIGFDAYMAHASCTSSVSFPNNHMVIYINSVEKDGDRFLVETALGFPTFQAINLDFETESPIYINSFLELKYIKHDGKILRMHRKGDLAAKLTKKENNDADFWIGDWRRFYHADVEGTNDFGQFEQYIEQVFVNPKSTPFHKSHRVVFYKGKKSYMVINGNCLIEDDEGELQKSELKGGDDEIVSTIQTLSPSITEDLIRKSLFHWRKTVAAS